MEHEIAIEDRQIAKITVYRGVCSCKLYRTPWFASDVVPAYRFIEHLNDVEQANAHDIAP